MPDATPDRKRPPAPPTSVRIPPRVRTKVRRAARKMDRSQSWFIVRALEEKADAVLSPAA